MGLDISKTDNKVTLVDNNKSITVTDNNKDISINVTQPITSTAEVSTAGPRGATGATGATGPSGSATSGPDTSVQFRDGITTSGSSDFTFIKATGGVTATSFSGSFSGSGADLINIPASGITGLNLSRISSGSVTASISPNSGLVVNTNISASSYVSASSFWAPPGVINQLTASYAISASVEITKEVSSSHANTADYALAGPFLSSSAQIANDISGSLGTNATLIRSLTAAGISGSWQNQTSSMSVLSASYATTASYVLNAVSASYAVSASHEIIKEVSSSHADTASFAQSGTGIFSGSFSGSYAGDGSSLTGISPFPFTGDASITGSLTVSGSFHAFKLDTDNVILGAGAAANIVDSAEDNVIIGTEAAGNGIITTTADKNVIMGWRAGYGLTNGYQNVIIGREAGYLVAGSDFNVFIGSNAGEQTEGQGNIGIGQSAGRGKIGGGANGDMNISIGLSAGYSLANPDYNILIGREAGYYVGDGSNNIMMGYRAGYTTSGSSADNNTFLGYNAGHDVITGANNIIIGSGSIGSGAISNQLRIGSGNSLTTISGSLATGDVHIYNTASAAVFSGSTYYGDGSNLTGISSGFWTGSGATISREGDVAISGSLFFSGSTQTTNPRIEFQDGIIIGKNITLYTGSFGDIAIGQNANTNYAGTYQNTHRRTALGYYASTTAGGATAIGANSIANLLGTAIGKSAEATGQYAVSIGYESEAASYCTAVGNNASAGGSQTTTLGASATAASNYGTAIGYNANGGLSSVAVGHGTLVSGQNSVGIGINADCTTNGITIGGGIQNTGAYSIVLGTCAYAQTRINTEAAVFKTYLNNETTASLKFQIDGTSHWDGGGQFGFGTKTPSATLTVSGSFTVTGSSIMSSSNSEVALRVIGSGSTVFDVIGSTGTLFSVDDDLTGMLFTTNDISGLPILQASASGETFIGKSPQSLYTTAVISATSASSTASLCTLSTSSYDGAFFDYTMTSGSNAKAGNIMSVWNGGTVNYTEVSTTDIGTTSGINFEVIISASTAQLVTVTDSTDPNIWKVKTIIRSI